MYAITIPGKVIGAAVAACFSTVLLATGASGASVTTYHNDNYRTGWNGAESSLTPAAVQSGGFGLLSQTALDEQVDAQPLFLPAVQIAGGTYDVVYVATENDTIYAIDANTGNILLSQTYGTAVSQASLPGQCNNNSVVVGINSTPVIDAAAGILYFIAYSVEGGRPVYRLHGVSVTTLADVVASTVVSASAPLSNGRPLAFNASFQRQRSGLLLSGGTIYAGFASFCDISAQDSRGWVLGWSAANLSPLAGNKLTNQRVRSANSFFLSSVWMSGFGLAADLAGNVYFATGNSDPGGTSYNPVFNLSESVIKMSPDLTTVEGFFTAGNHRALDEADADLASGGVMLVPQQSPSSPNMAVAGGKSDNVYLLDTDVFSTTTQAGNRLGAYTDDGCWCGPAYYVGSDGVARVVTSTGQAVRVWQIESQGTPKLKLSRVYAGLDSGPDPGFFTSVSSNGTQAATALIWAVLRAAPNDPTNTLMLTAFDPTRTTGPVLSVAAGTWPYAYDANSDTVPVVANGHVFVATYKQLAIFGLSNGAGATPASAAVKLPPVVSRQSGSKYALFGSVQSSTDTTLSVELRSGRTLTVDLPEPASQMTPSVRIAGATVLVLGDKYAASGELIATSVQRVKNVPAKWPADR